MNQQAAVVAMTDAVVAKGQRAWGKIKATAAEQRELWRQVGEALNVGRRMHKADQKFSQWCKEMGFDMKAPVRSDAMWWATEGYTACKPPEGMTHPTHIRQWHRDQPKDPLPAELLDTNIEVKTVPTVDQKTAEKVAKLVNRAKAKDEGSEIAQRHLDAVAKKHGVETDALKEAASIQAPHTYFQFTPELITAVEEMKSGLLEDARAMRQAGVTTEAIVAVFMNVIAALKKEN